MKIGLIGLGNSGKTTIFNALTGLEAEVTAYSSQKLEPNIGVVNVEDERITWLSELYQPKKTIYAAIEFTDFAGLSSGSKEGEAFSAESMGLIQSQGTPQPAADINNICDEMILSDIMISDKRLERIEKDKKRGLKNAELLVEEHTLIRIQKQLNQMKPIRDMELTADEEKAVRGFRFLTQKSLLIILNSDENNFGQQTELISELEKEYKVIEMAGNFEMELSKLDEEEADMFMADMNIEESAVNRLVSFAYRILGLISFFTVGKDEVRAWTISAGDNAVEAAGKIHSDLARGFIRAECFGYDDLKNLGSERALKENNKMRLEAKNYIVKDGDILNIRFSV